MAANGSTFDLIPARRPSLDDVGGASFEDDLEFPPNPETDPSAAMMNAVTSLVAAYGAVIYHTVLSIRFANGSPSISALSCVRKEVTAATFKVAHNGNGDTSITWPEGTLPPASTQPTGSMNID